MLYLETTHPENKKLLKPNTLIAWIMQSECWTEAGLENNRTAVEPLFLKSNVSASAQSPHKHMLAQAGSEVAVALFEHAHTCAHLPRQCEQINPIAHKLEGCKLWGGQYKVRS